MECSWALQRYWDKLNGKGKGDYDQITAAGDHGQMTGKADYYYQAHDGEGRGHEKTKATGSAAASSVSNPVPENPVALQRYYDRKGQGKMTGKGAHDAMTGKVSKMGVIMTGIMDKNVTGKCQLKMTGKGTGKGDYHVTGKGDNDMLGNVKGEVYVQLTGASGYEMTGNVKSEIYVEMANAGDYEVMMLGRGKMTGKDSKAKNKSSCKRWAGALAGFRNRTTRPLRRLTGKQTVA